MLSVKLKCLDRQNVLGVGNKPYFSWTLSSDEQGVKQQAYRLTVKNGQEVVWDTGVEKSSQSIFIEYLGKPLISRTKYTCFVWILDNKGNEAQSQTSFETGIFNSDWKAKWVVSSLFSKRKKNFFPVSYFRKKFILQEEIEQARVYATSHGCYRLTVNGKRPDEREFAPEYTAYEKFLCVQTYDITNLLIKGGNAIGVIVADGWYNSKTTKQTYPGWDARHACLWQLEVIYKNGDKEIICSDEAIKVSSGAIQSADLFKGESFDARKERETWDRFSFDDKVWDFAVIVDFGYENLVPQEGEFVRSFETIPVQSVLTTPRGETLLDFGQNIAGRLRMKLDLPRDTIVTFEHSETLDEYGNYFNNIMGINQKDIFISNGSPYEYEPTFTFHGFRYVRITGIKQIRKEDFFAVALSTDSEWLMQFECSDNRINRLIQNIRYSQKANMLSIPTDCPQREKMGWTGDMNVYAKTAFQNQNLTGLVSRWLKSLSIVQQSDGQVPHMVPFPDFYKFITKITNLLLGSYEKNNICSAGWGDAAITVPWELYLATGNVQILKEQYPSMKKWVEYIRLQTEKNKPKKNAYPDEVEKYLWDTGSHFGEWLIPSCTQKGSMSKAVRKSAILGRKYITTPFYYLACRRLAAVAHILGYEDESKIYANLSDHIKEAYRYSMVNPDGTLKIDVQGAYAIALGIDLIPTDLKKTAAKCLAELISANDDRLDTGFLATPYLLDALFENGQKELAYKLLYKSERPSWLYEVKQGATTVWESWNAKDEKGRPEKISFNHYSFGCVADWIYRRIGGISNKKPGYSHFIICPQPDALLTWAKQNYSSPYGSIVSEWKKENGKFILHIEIPCNSHSTVILPDGSVYEIDSGKYDFMCQDLKLI